MFSYCVKSSSDNPILIVSGEASTSKLKSKGQTYAPLRERIMYSELDKLVLDVSDLGLIQGMSELSTDDQVLAMPPPPTDIASIFPDLQPYGLLEVAPAAPEGRKKSDRRGDRDDPNKRAEDTTYQKITPMSDFVFNRPRTWLRSVRRNHAHKYTLVPWSSNDQSPSTRRPVTRWYTD